ncbi:MAG: hypothetical protein Q8914_13265, partial [Bacteroidota bacterium]|nr:hypothetical protein [Bacteroidota bacterium]
MNVIVSLLLCLTMLLLFTQCSKDIDSYYDRPSWLEDPIYQELEANGNFKLYLQALDRTLHASVLKGAGLYTCYAPNDEAFTAWMKDKGYATVAAIPQQEVESLVSYSLVYNEIKADNLGAALVNKVWTPGIAYKYKTTYYPMLTREMYNGDSVWVFDSNNYGGYTYSTKSNMVGNYKYLPVFTKSFFNASSPQLTAADYLAFYPTSTWAADKGLGNVGPASIIGDQHLAENGTFYELNKIAEPIPNIYNVLKTDPDCAEIWKLINYKTAGSTAYYFKYFMTVDNLADQFKLIYPNKNIDKVYVRGVLGFGFDPVVERYNGEGSSADVTQEGGVTMFVPSNAAVSSFVKNKLMKYYTDFDQVPVVAVTAFLASQCCQSLVWPSYFNKKKNLLNEYLSGLSNGPDIDAFGVTGKIMASNGMVYKSDKLIKSAYFESVFSEIFLNPQYNFTYKTYNLYYSGESSLTAMLLRCPLNGYMGEKNTLLLFSDQKLKNDGFYYNDVDMVFNHKTLTASGAAARIKRLTNNHVFLGYSDTITIGVPFGTNWGSTANTGRYLTKNTGANLTAADFTREGISSYDKWQFRVTNNGEMVRFKNNKIQAAGNIEDGTYASIAPADG